MLSYRQILKRSFAIAWKNKYLWFFGLFASFLSIGAEYKILMRSTDRDAILAWFSGWQNFINVGIFKGALFVSIFNIFGNNPLVGFLLIVGVFIVLTLLAFVVWMVVSSQVVLVDNAKKIIKGIKDATKVSLHDEIKIGQASFWPVLFFNILVKVAVSVLVFLIVSPLLFISLDAVTANILYIGLFIILIPAAIFTSFIIKYAIAYVILERVSLKKALNKAWLLFRGNWIISTELSLILFLLSFLSTFVILMAATIIFVPFFLFAISFIQVFSAMVSWLTIILGIFVAAFFIIAAGSFLATWQTISWVHLFVSLTSHGGESKLERLLPEKLKNIIVFKK